MNSKPLFLHDDLDKYFYNRKNDIKKIRISDKLLKLLLASTNPINWTEGCWKDIPFKKIMADIEQSIVCTYMDISKIYALEKRKLTLEIVYRFDNGKKSI